MIRSTSNLVLICLVVALQALVGCSDKPVPSQAAASERPTGQLYESHTFKNCPTIRIYMKGWQDAFFDAFIEDAKGEKLLARDLPALKSQFRSITNNIAIANRATRISPRLGGKMYDVYWSPNLQRVGIAFYGNWVAAYDISTGAILKLPSEASPEVSAGFHTAVQGFLEKNH